MWVIEVAGAAQCVTPAAMAATTNAGPIASVHVILQFQRPCAVNITSALWGMT